MTSTSRWAWIASTVAALAAGLVLAFLLSNATNDPSLYERHYVWLFWLNVALASVLVLVIVVTGIRLLWRVSRGRFGSRLLLKLAAIFALVGVVPGLVIYTVSYQFVSRSIESWFDVRVEGALDAGLNLGRGTIDSLVADLASKTRQSAERLAESSVPPDPLALERLREQLSAQDVSIVGSAGQTLITTGPSVVGLMAERPSPQLLRQAHAQRVASIAEGLDEDSAGNGNGGGAGHGARVRAVALIPSSNFALGEQDRYLVVTQSIAPSLAANALAVTSAYREYQQRSLARSGLRKMYIGTLTLALVLAVFGALLLAVALSNQLAQPLLLLAEGVSEVARGDFRSKPVFASRDELGGLTRSFAEMTEQLSEARELVHRSVVQAEGARANLQTILDNLTAGVMVFDRTGAIDTVNPGATRILRLPLSAYRGRRLEDVPGLGEFGQSIRQRFDLHAASPEAGERDHWQDSFELKTTGPGGRERDSITLLVRGAAMPQGARLMVFDDITELVSAQRVEAWSEVARRLAHEIKNPLTPIQLSAERMRLKLAGKLEGNDRGMLERSVETIVNQVQAMKTLVNEFRDYARLPATHLVALDLNALVGEVLGLYGSAQESGRLHAELGQALPGIVGDGTQLRQVIHNLVQNALDAVAERDDGRVRLFTEAARNEAGEVRAVRLVIVDNGPGFSEKVLKRAFEPYVTTKTKGTGLGLAVVKKIADEHGARIRIVNLGSGEGGVDRPGRGERGVDDAAAGARGAQVSLSFSKLAPSLHAGAAEAAHASPP
ncbi:MAG TPA: ATP-binding protein [Caldimonas sp.]|nr:ATP-binding protein [Caldimonas sp.]